VGKTEIARRVARLIDAQFVKVEATKFSEVGYVGRDVDSIIRDLAEAAFNMEHDRRLSEVRQRAEQLATERIINYLIDQRAEAKTAKRASKPARMQAQAGGGEDVPAVIETSQGSGSGGSGATTATAEPPRPVLSERALKTQRRKMERLLAEHKLDEEQIEIDINDAIGMDDLSGVLEFMPGMSPEEMSDSFNDFLDSYRNLQEGVRGRRRMRRVSVREAQRILTDEEAHRMLDLDAILESAMQRAEQAGVVFIDEIDKIAGPQSETGPDVSRQGVQRDLLPIVEGSTVQTRYGPVKTDHILFIGAGAFHATKPSDLIPELQGRFPLRAELQGLSEKDLVAILTEPENSLTRQYEAMMQTEGVELEFTREGLERVAAVAAELNDRLEDIGARRLHTIMEQVLEDLSFRAEEEEGKKVVIDAAYVDDRVKSTAKDDDLSRFIL
jgi:ATP-dependent HslUV protease ATP-binding subunit HslU